MENNSKILSNLTSLELYLNFPAKKVVRTYNLEDVACGMYPCFYSIEDDHLLASTSVVSLIKERGKLEVDENFKPFFLFKNWHEGTRTVDKNIKKLYAFEKRNSGSSEITFDPKKTLRDKDEYINQSIYYFEKFISEIEDKFPDYDHIVLTGGKDSQLINLLEKKKPEKWHVFTSKPNLKLIEKWVEINDIKYGKFFKHDNKNDEDKDFLIKKIMNNDMIGDPEHIRWSKKLIEISNEFNKKCIFWFGSKGETLYNNKISTFRKGKCKNYFQALYDRGASWQGNVLHQAVFNLTGCPSLSLYHSKEIWEDLYQRLDPMMITPPKCSNEDLRKELGNKIAKKEIKWVKLNPTPIRWLIFNLGLKINLLNIYIEEIRKLLK